MTELNPISIQGYHFSFDSLSLGRNHEQLAWLNKNEFTCLSFGTMNSGIYPLEVMQQI